ncbi:MAG: hypothetical protein IPL46_01475 [Saprospiraceae bacterium]|nr:hypothetical protein [Saprospiraceae bacterium]
MRHALSIYNHPTPGWTVSAFLVAEDNLINVQVISRLLRNGISTMLLPRMDKNVLKN